MRDCFGVERGRCTHCLSQGFECCELVLRVPGHADIDFDDAFHAADPEEYRQDPVLACIRSRIDRKLLDIELAARDSDGNGACASCGCSPESHEVVVLSAEEDRILTIVRRLYAAIDIQDCVCQSTRDTLSLGFTRDNFTYGEVGNLSFLHLLDNLTPQSTLGGVFYDLGCGVGKAVALAALHKIRFRKCVGIELLPGLCAIARHLCSHFSDDVAPEKSLANSHASEIEFIEGDLFNSQLVDATAILINIGCWEEPNISSLRKHLIQCLPHACKVITIRKQLALTGSLDLLQLEELHLPMSWGMAAVFVAERRRDHGCTANVQADISLDALD